MLRQPVLETQDSKDGQFSFSNEQESTASPASISKEWVIIQREPPVAHRSSVSLSPTSSTQTEPHGYRRRSRSRLAADECRHSAEIISAVIVRLDKRIDLDDCRLEVCCTDHEGRTWSTWRTFAEFFVLHAHIELQLYGTLAKLHAAIPAPSRQWKVSRFVRGRNTLEERIAHFQAYLGSLMALKIAKYSTALCEFLSPPKRQYWPSAYGPIDINHHDGPHPEAPTEWWYFNTHLKSSEGRSFSVFVCFFRIACEKVQISRGLSSSRSQEAVPLRSLPTRFGYAVHWAITDVETKEYHWESLLDKTAVSTLKYLLANGKTSLDRFLQRALLEVLEKGSLPLPDILVPSDAYASSEGLNISLGNAAQLWKDTDGSYNLQFHQQQSTRASREIAISCKLCLRPTKFPVRHDADGVVSGSEGDDMFYYFIPRCSVTGAIKLGGQQHNIVRGNGWYDHEFGGKDLVGSEEIEDQASEDEQNTLAEANEALLPRDMGFFTEQYCWDWFSVQLSNNYDVTIARLVNFEDKSVLKSSAIIISPSGKKKYFETVEFTELKHWTSSRTFSSYPIEWKVEVIGADLSLYLSSKDQPDQEFITLISSPGYWEGRCAVRGTLRRSKVKGWAYYERHGYQPVNKLSDFLERLGEHVRKNVQNIYPDASKLSRVHANSLVTTSGTSHHLDNVDLSVLAKSLMEPVRLIADRGGKSWRSYAALACCDAVGGDSRRYANWISFPEFVHVGSLIVDDVEDSSTLRRGGPCAHLLYGTPLSINAGTAAYFQGASLLQDTSHLSPQIRNRLYDLYFATLRAAHAGQALDLYGLDYLMEEATQSDKMMQDVLQKVRNIHLLKTAAPAGHLARMGAIAGGGTERQIQALGFYFESLGLAFQIMDDVLNLRGLHCLDNNSTNKVGDLSESEEQNSMAGNDRKTLKTVGEDISHGKLTMPVVVAMCRMSIVERYQFWQTLKSKPNDAATISGLIETIENLGALDHCMKEARGIIEDGWRQVEPIIPDTFSKIMLRCLGWFVCERSQL